MTTRRDVAQQALEALEQCGLDDTHRSYEFENAARAALRAALRKALAQPEQDVPEKDCGNMEPVAWQWLNTAHFRKKLPAKVDPSAWNPLYTHPPRREWRGLTEEDIPSIRDGDTAFRSGALWADRLLKEKNNG